MWRLLIYVRVSRSTEKGTFPVIDRVSLRGTKIVFGSRGIFLCVPVMEPKRNMKPDPKRLTAFQKGLLILVGLLNILHDTVAECQCNLNYSTRATRDLETERVAKEYITNFTTNQTIYLLNLTIPPFNLTSHLGKVTANQTIPDFVLRGSLYGVPWNSFTQGYNGTNDTKLFSINNNCTSTSCYPAWVSLADYLRNEYVRMFTISISRIAGTASHPLGRYRQSLIRSYNYSSYDFANQPPLTCFCRVFDGYSYRVRFSINATYLKPNNYDATSVTGMLTLTDVELAIDGFCAYIFGESYIQSSFERWEPPVNGSTFYAMIYFNGVVEADCNNSLTNITSNLSSIKFFWTKYLKLGLIMTSPPVATECYLTNSTKLVTTTTTMTQTSTSASTFGDISSTSASTFEDIPSTSASTFGDIPSTLASTFEDISSTSASTFEDISDPSSLASTTSAAISFSSTEGTSSTNGSTQQYPVSTTPATMTLLQTLSVTTNPDDTQSSSTIANTITVPKQNLTSITILGTTSQTIQSNVNALSTATSIKMTPSSANPTNGTETQSTLNGLTKMTAMTSRKVSNSSTTPFDKDPFFKAEVPVITKIYNDRYLLKGIGATARSVVEDTFFYTVAIPAAAGMLFAIVLCLVLCQIDYNAVK